MDSTAPGQPAVRKAQDCDSSGIRILIAAATQELRRVYKPRPVASQPAPEEAESLVAVVGDRIVGIVEYVTREASIYVRGLAVHPEYRRKGVARALLSEVAQVARQSNRATLTLSTIQETGNPAIFERLGFVTKESRPSPRFVDAADGPVMQIDMVCRLEGVDD
ncbi:MAG: GNAT family N-acetyltransferase [Zoogloea oleivorans]|jgi:GNAT superfamily N-acetyltransferase|uniref:GNAT family N-acetyltransferase n=1 Tax=Zoogloea oleivorans TaxID=1552750 RepID=UPI002A362BE2|nr:GNAT family N-acetyltransferase [Zoogloea oleivorans]MDY0036595.1 GNAT family N-acetyltransferase [Zoogloea oleivorans]